MKAKTRIVSFRLPEHLARRISARGRNRSAVIIDALSRHLDGAPKFEQLMLERTDVIIDMLVKMRNAKTGT